ncbi:MAG: hypothetical protein V1492_03505 [Candidatus Micrarchaeota archaeon]
MMKLAKTLPAKEVITQTGFSRKEAKLLEKGIQLFRLLEDKGVASKTMTVGGFAIRFYINDKFTDNMKRGSATDVDLAFIQIPDWIKTYLRLEHLIEVERVNLTTLKAADNCQTIKQTPHTVYHIQPQYEKSMELLSDVCFFEQNVTLIKIRPEDLERVSILTVHTMINGVNIEAPLRVADPGFLLATIFNASAATEMRVLRGIMMLASQDKAERTETIERYAEIVTANGLADGHGNLALHEPFSYLKQNEVWGKRNLRPIINEFIEAVQTKIGKIVDPNKLTVDST